MSDIQSSEVDRLLSVWQYASEIPLAVLCRKHPELLAQLELKISIIRHIQRLAPPPVSSDNIFTLSVDDTTISPAEQSTVPPVLLFGESIDCYRLVRVLGQGGMGIVWEAEDTSFSRLVALKMMLPGLLTHEKARDRFLREARAQAAVLHEHVAVIHAVGERDGVPFIVMPLLSGATLADRLLAEPGLNLNGVLRLGREIAEGLAAAHEKRLIHRDVKPSNIWLEGPTEHVRLLDFGLARPVDDTANPSITASGTVLGTPAYMSPEQAVSQKVDARADLFSLGVVLYEMSTGNRPFAGASTLSVMQALATVRPAIPGVLSELIEGLLVKDPEARHPQSAAELVENFKLIEAGQEPPPLRRRVVTKKSNRWRLRAGLAVLVPLILVVGYQVLNATSAGTGTTVPVDPFKVAVEKFEMTVLPQLKNKPLKFTSEDDDSNGTVAAKRTTYWRYTGQTGIPRLNVENDHIILQIPYIGQCNRKAYEFGILAAQQTEASRGNLVVKLRFKEDRFHIASMRREQASGEQEKAELAIEQLLRQVMQ